MTKINHVRDSYLRPLSARLFAILKIIVLSVTLFAGLYSCTVVTMTKQTAFYHPLIYQIAFGGQQARLLPEKKIKDPKLTHQNLLLIQLSVNSLNLMLLLVIVTFCTAFIEDVRPIHQLRKRIGRKKVTRFISTCRQFVVLRNRTSSRKMDKTFEYYMG